MEDKALVIFENFKIRRHYDETKEKWYFSVVDIIQALTEQSEHKKAQSYWTTLKNRLKEEGSEVVTNCDQLKMQANDGKFYNTDAADVETLLRLVQSVPSPKAEPIKLWLAKVGYERMQEMMNPEKSIDRARENWKKYGRSEKWIQQRMTGQETRNKLTDYWKEHDVKEGQEFAILTNIIHKEWTDLTIGEHKKLKGLKTQNLRDHMSEAELIFTALAELSTRQIAETENAKGMIENEKASKKGGSIAKRARLELESETGKKVVTGKNFLGQKEEHKKLKE
jgi:DNA-damage-inducible protein D